MELDFSGEVIEWRGPAPYLFVRMPTDEADAIADHERALTYGWGCIPVTATFGTTTVTTSLFPKFDTYLVPVKVAVQRAEGIGLGDVVRVRLVLDVR